MENLNEIIAGNLITLRKQHKMTQLELAQKLNFSDKSVSKWEKGESIPSVEILVQLAEIYGVTLDYFTHENKGTKEFVKAEPKKYNKLIISLLSISVVWILATAIYVYSNTIFNLNVWTVFIWAFPVSFVLAIIFNAIWGKRKYIFWILSGFLWTLATAVFLQFLEYHLWLIFILAVPFQITIILWSGLKPRQKTQKQPKSKQEKEANAENLNTHKDATNTNNSNSKNTENFNSKSANNSN